MLEKGTNAMPVFRCLRKQFVLWSYLSVYHCRVATADTALCVLSLADAEPMGSEGFIPDTVHKLISPSTFILLNKTDLSDDARVQRARLALGDCAGAWAVSLSTGRGLETFVDEFSSMLHQRYGA